MKVLLVDIETAPMRVYSWGLFKQDIHIDQIEEPGYTMCWAAKWYGKSHMMFASLYSDTKEQMLEKIYNLLDEADVVIHYNGTKFDLPILNQEFLSVGFGPPSPVINIDLLSTARRRFRLPSNKLSYVARHLGLKDKVRHRGMELWRDCMNGDKKAWVEMRRYNKRDVELLEEVYEKLKPWVPNHPNHALFNDSLERICPNCGGTHLQKRGLYYTKTLTYQRYHCQECGGWSRSRTTNTDVNKRRNVLVGVS
jgi:DNA polymerase elongation subunit (family B)